MQLVDFGGALSEKGFKQWVKACKGAKKTMQGMMVSFMVIAVGESHATSIDICMKLRYPFVLQSSEQMQLPVHYFSQIKAWMTGDILDQVL